VLAAAILAVSGFHIHYSQEARMYPLLALTATLYAAAGFFFAKSPSYGRAMDSSSLSRGDFKPGVDRKPSILTASPCSYPAEELIKMNSGTAIRLTRCRQVIPSLGRYTARSIVGACQLIPL
jgi:hypothetical protein